MLRRYLQQQEYPVGSTADHALASDVLQGGVGQDTPHHHATLFQASLPRVTLLLALYAMQGQHINRQLLQQRQHLRQ